MFLPHHTAISVSCLDRSVGFYEKLGFKVVMRWQADDESLSIVHMILADMLLELFCYVTTVENGSGAETLEGDLKTIGVKHFGLRVNDINAALQQLIESGLAAASTAVTRGRTGIEYLFIRDPDGLFVEIVQDDRDFTHHVVNACGKGVCDEQG